MHSVAAFFASIIAFVSGFFAPTVASNSPVDVRTTQPAAAAAVQTEITGDPFNDPAAASVVVAAIPATVPASAFSPPPTQTVINQPVIERIIERVVPQGDSRISADTLAAILSDFEQSISSRIAAINPPKAAIPEQVAAAGNSAGYYFAPGSQRIDQLTNTAINTPTITGGIIAGANVAGYLPLSGGMLTGALSGTDLNLSGNLTAGTLSVAGLSSGGALFAPYFSATSTTATSTFAGGITASYASSTQGFFRTLTVSSLSLTTPLSAENGGTGISNPTAGGILIGSFAGGAWQQIATSSLGLLSTNVAEGSNLYFTNARADARINATTTIGTLASAPNLGTVATSLTGFLKATAGVLSTSLIDLASDVTGILPVNRGGTGWAALASGSIPYGNGSGAVATTSAGTAGQVLALLNGVPTWTATTTFSAPLLYAGGAVSIAQANGSTNGYLLSGDWTLFNNKIASSSLSAAYPMSYNSSTGVFSTAISTTSVSVRDFGSSTTCTGTTDDYTAFNAAVSAVVARGGGTVMVPSGAICQLSAAITVPGSVIVQGLGSRSIVRPYATTSTLFNITAGGTGIKNLSLNNVSGKATSAITVSKPVSGPNSNDNLVVDISSNYIGSFTYGILWTGGDRAAIDNNTFVANTYGISFINNGMNSVVTRNYVLGGNGIVFTHDATDNQVEGTRIAFNSVLPGNIGTTTYGLKLYGGLEVVVTGNIFDQNYDGDAVVIQHDTTHPVVYVKLSDNWYGGGGSASYGLHVIGAANHISSSNDTAIGWQQAGFYFEGLSTGFGVDNSIEDPVFSDTAPNPVDVQVAYNSRFHIIGARFTATTPIVEGTSVQGSIERSTFVNSPTVSGLTLTGIVANTGNLGFGTTTPWASLALNGSFAATCNKYNTGALPLTRSTSYNICTNFVGNREVDFWNTDSLATRSFSFLQRDASSYAVLATIMASGAFGIGTTTPWAQFSINQFNGGSAPLFVVASSTGSGATSTIAIIDKNGYLGIGTTTPTAQLSTTGTVRFSNFGAGTLTTDASGNLSVSSDERLKNIDGTFTRGLADIVKLSPISYHWNALSGLDTSTQYAGFSAQNVQTAIPEAIGSSTSGYLTLQDRPLIAATINAIKELSAKLDALQAAMQSFAERFVSKEITATNRLCIGATCVTESQLQAILAAAGQSDISPSTAPPVGAPQAPVLELNGNTSSTIEVGDTYNDLGVRITAPESDLNLGIVILLDGATTSAISIDTTAPGEHTILYTVTSPTSGLTGSAMRTVIVSPATQSSEPPANDNPFNTPPVNDNVSTSTLLNTEPAAVNL